ncbi:MAG: hypothetical protein CM15mP49_20520 [Actinomycetota bacterium]|nr:MAG: hypothetical protein CM15mP49_20520 [Actinomycetota bacterium]
MYIDRDIDKLMERTKNRPLVTGVLTSTEALSFAIAIEAIAFVWLWIFVNLLSAVLAASAAYFMYSYTVCGSNDPPQAISLSVALRVLFQY